MNEETAIVEPRSPTLGRQQSNRPAKRKQQALSRSEHSSSPRQPRAEASEYPRKTVSIAVSHESRETAMITG
jgi:hypothetical protein